MVGRGLSHGEYAEMELLLSVAVEDALSKEVDSSGTTGEEDFEVEGDETCR